MFVAFTLLAAATEVVLIFGGVILFIVVIVFIAMHVEKKRTEALRAAAAELSLEFDPTGAALPLNQLDHFDLTSRGRGRRVSNLMHGSAEDVRLSIFDYAFTVGSGKSAQHYHSSVVLFASPRLSLPSFSLRPEGLFSKLGAALGMQDIDFPSHPKFSGMFVLKAQNEPAVRALFSDELLTELESLKGISAEGNGSELLYFRLNRRTKAEEVRSLFDEAFTVFNRFAAASAARPAAALGSDLPPPPPPPAAV